MTQHTEPTSPAEGTRKWWLRMGFWALFLLSTAGLSQLHNWKRETKLSRYLPGSFEKTWRQFQSTNRDFGFSRGLIFTLEAPKGKDVFAPSMVALIRGLTKKLNATRGIQRVVSLANSPSIRKKGDAMVVQPLFPQKLSAYQVAQQKKARAIAMKDPLLRGSLVSANGRATLIIAFLNPPKKGAKPTGSKTVKQTLSLLRQITPKGSKVRWGLVGEPFVGPLFEQSVRPQIVMLLGLFFTWTLLMFFLFVPGWKRRLWFASSGVIVLFLGVSSHMGWHSNLHASVHLIPLWIWWIVGLWAMHYTRPSETQSGPSWLLLGTLMLLSWSVVLSFHPWPMLQRWGLTTSFSLVSLLAVVHFFPPPTHPITPQEQQPLTWSTLTQTLGLALLLLLGVGFVWLPLGVSSLQHTYPRNGLLAHGDRISDEHFGGAVPFFIRYKGDLQDPVHLKSMERVGNRLASLPGVAPVQSYGVIIRQLHNMLNQIPRIPDSRLKISSLAILLEGQPALASLIRNKNRDGVIQGRIKLKDPWKQKSLLAKFQHALRDLPLRYKKINWSKASSTERKQLLLQRVKWVEEGISLWLKRNTGLSLTPKQLPLLRRALMGYLMHLQKAPKALVLHSMLLRKSLLAYLKSEDCDLELKQALKNKVLLALLKANRKGLLLHKKQIKSVLLQALAGTEAGKDKSSIKYASKSLSAITQRIRQNQQLTLLQQGLFRLFGTNPAWPKVAAPKLRAGGSHSARVRIAALRGELLELHNPHWHRRNQGPTRLVVQHTGLHKMLLPLAKDTLQQGSLAAAMMMVTAFLACWLMLGSLAAAWQVWLPLPITWLAILGLLGWQNIPVDLLVTFFLLFLTGFSIFPSLYLYHVQTRSTPSARLPHRRTLARMALWISLPASPLLITAIPPMQHTGLLLTFGPWIALLACLTVQAKPHQTTPQETSNP